MPNWCNNQVTITHADPAMVERVKSAFERGELLQEFIPCPEELHSENAHTYGGDPLYDATRMALKNKYGYENALDFQRDKWGTKWDIGGKDATIVVEEQPENPPVLTLLFDSAWTPPTDGYYALQEMGFEIKAYYVEYGCGFCGSFDGEFGDSSYDLPATSEQIRALIPSDIDAAMSISDTMELWESEDEDCEEETQEIESP